MAHKRLKQKLEAVNSKMRHWIFETQGEYNPTGISNFVGTLKDDNGRIVMIFKEDEDFNQLSRLLNTSKYMRRVNDMKGLAEYVWDRNLVLMEEEEKESWKKKHVVPLDITMKVVV